MGGNDDRLGITEDEEAGQAKAAMDDQNQGGHERERRTTRIDVEASRQIHRPHTMWD